MWFKIILAGCRPFLHIPFYLFPVNCTLSHKPCNCQLQWKCLLMSVSCTKKRLHIATKRLKKEIFISLWAPAEKKKKKVWRLIDGLMCPHVGIYQASSTLTEEDAPFPYLPPPPPPHWEAWQRLDARPANNQHLALFFCVSDDRSQGGNVTEFVYVDWKRLEVG
jgi:hypothetical protein